MALFSLSPFQLFRELTVFLQNRPTILSDREIRYLALEHALIKPFTPAQVREIYRRKVISFGVSSYGYDLCLSDQDFRIFRHIPGTVVDPKNFCPENVQAQPLHEDSNGQFFILPSHSYALGVSAEKLKMPPNVTGLCVGKCLTASVRILNTDSCAYESIKEFSGLNTASFFMTDQNHRSVSAGCMPVISQGMQEVYELTTKSGLKIKGTYEHPFLTKTGWKFLGDLTTDDFVATPTKLDFFGNNDIDEDESILLALMIANGQCDTPGGSPSFTSKDKTLVSLLEEKVQKVLDQPISQFQPYGYRLVNKLGRGGVATKNRATEWLQSYDLTVGSTLKFVPQRIFMAPKPVIASFLRTLFSCDGCIAYHGHSNKRYSHLKYVQLSYSTSSRQLIEDVAHLLLRFGIFGSIREKHPKIGNVGYELTICASNLISLFLNEIGFIKGCKKDLRVEDEIFSILNAIESKELHTDGVFWQKVKEVLPAGNEEVFDLEVPHFRNFLANNFIVHNSTYARCGVICNITPLEAAWEGHLTIELSNSSDADCRIYANEGICQIAFFRGLPCDISYAIRHGKYQHQPHEVVLARV